MANLRSLLWLAVGAAVVVAGWLLIAPHLFPGDWRFAVGSPSVIGDSDDPFAYAGGESVRPVEGSGTVRISSDGRGTIRLSIDATDAGPSLSLRDGTIVGQSWDLISIVDASAVVWTETAVHGDSGVGDARLPTTTALIAGCSLFDLTVGGNRRLTELIGTWSIGDALRREDGSIRQQGLVFSPLLRDKTGFSDPERLELTLLLYEDGLGSDVLAHVVFRSVIVEQAPSSP